MVGDFLETSISYRLLQAGVTVPGKSAGSSRARPAAVGQQVPAGYADFQPAVASSASGDKYSQNQKELTELCKRRFFYRQAFDIYGGVAGFFTYGPPGCAVKNNLIKRWRQHFVIEENLLEIEDTCIMQHQVLKASGHVDRFNDFMVKDVLDHEKFYRADKLLEEIMEKKLEEPGITEEQKKEYTIVKNMADGYSKDEIGAIFKKYEIKAPDSGNDLSDPYEFNLMFPTPIGPGGYLQGYLRPETAQGIFLNYKYCVEQNSNRLPFGVAQVGRAFRNEIAPRAGLTRQREFTQAEIEYFVNPKGKAHPKFQTIAHIDLTLYHSNEQLAGKEPTVWKVGPAVAQGIINNETLAYYMVRTYLFLTGAGIKPEHLRFRQHLPTEMAHYACDCWDAEILSSYGWLESVGIADRACFDLNAHATAAKCDLAYKEKLDKPIEKEVLQITKKSGIEVMKALKKDGKAAKEQLEAMPEEALAALEKAVQSTGKAEIEVNGQKYTLTSKELVFEKKMEKQSIVSFTPGVIEPSFGIDRIFACVMEHAYYCRVEDTAADDNDKDKGTRGVLAFAASIAPYKCTILPLDQRISRHEKYQTMGAEFRTALSSMGLAYTLDESGATIGRRYARNDELGIPYAITVDFDSVGMGEAKLEGTVTLRDRDTMEQIRLPMKGLADVVRNLVFGEVTWQQVAKK
eukprot:TRINITY_DN11653_c0_g1_i1.p1 TRINITY_DN11653_c0_g1~~TRINITY_DN11653_c0_g1_i1.p1  ORF type:complete len:686 (+),score=204.95 TRINITY_DN11653_c0_g1_i1:167-2224(+)